MPTRSRRLPALAAVAATALACTAAPAPALEHTRMEAFWVAADGQGGTTGGVIPVLLNLPHG